MGKVATLAEVRAARQFLSAIHAPTNNNLLIIAVVAWMRVEGKGFKVLEAASQLLKAAIYTPISLIGLPGYAASGTAQLNATNAAKAEAFKLVLLAARKGQPSDFLYALALSSWDAEHFGGFPNNALLKMYGTFTGLNLPQPKVSVPKPPPLPTQIAPKLHPVPRREYLQPYESRGFFEERNRPIPELPR